MPELPEVETIRRELARDLLDKRIVSVEILATKSVHNSLAAFRKQLVGNSFTGINRQGKLLIFKFKRDGEHLLVHLKMTGQLIYQFDHRLVFGGHNISESDLRVPNRFTRVAINFNDKSVLYFNDMRRFGFLKLVPDSDVNKLVAKSYGLDALDPRFNKKYLAGVLVRRAKTNIKAALLDQKHLAGIGNIYADEVCFAVKVKPNRLVKTLTPSQIGATYTQIKRVLNLAIKHGGTTFTSSRRSNAKADKPQFLDGHYVRSSGGKGNFTNYLKVYGRQGKTCLRCRKGIIQKTRVAGRGTHFCPVCQY